MHYVQQLTQVDDSIGNLKIKEFIEQFNSQQ